MPDVASRPFALLVFLTFALMTVVTALSATMRLSNAGLGCGDWPACYGRNLSPSFGQAARSDAGSSIGAIHRFAAGAMGLLVLAVAFLSLRRRAGAPAHFWLGLLLLALMVFLAALGKWTPDVHLPAVALANLLGGLAMLALLWWLCLDLLPAARSGAASPGLKVAALAGLALLSAQLFLGGSVSAHFAAASCTTLPDCGSAWWPQGDFFEAANPFRRVELDAAGKIANEPALQMLHMAHRLFTLIVALHFAWLGAWALKRGMKKTGGALLAALALQIVSGSASVKSGLSLAVVVAHNVAAALLLLAAVTLIYHLFAVPHRILREQP